MVLVPGAALHAGALQREGGATMTLDELVLQSFVLIQADAMAGVVRTALATSTATHVVVERYEGNAQYWYLFPIEQARAMLAGDRDGPIVDAFGLHEWSASPTLPAGADTTNAPRRAVILREGHAVGFIDRDFQPPAAAPSAPIPAFGQPSGMGSGGGGSPVTRGGGSVTRGGGSVTRGGGSVTRGGQHAEPPAPRAPAGVGAEAAPTADEAAGSGATERSVQADFPTTVKADTIEWLLVSIVNAAPTATGLGIDVAAGESVDILVQPRRGFAVIDNDRGTLDVPATGESLSLQFKLKAVDIGPGTIRVLAFHRGEPLGVITLEPTVEPADDARSRGLTPSPRSERTGGALVAASPQIPDLSMFIEERDSAGKREFVIRLSASDPTLDLNLRPFGPFELEVDPAVFFESFFQEIEDLPLDTDADRQIADRKVAAKGAYLTETLMPADLRATLWQLRDHIRSIIVQSEEPWIPWELCRLVGQENGRVVEGPFLCEAFAMTRWLPGLGFKRPLHLTNLALVVPSDSGLPLAADERAYVLSLAGPGRAVTAIEPNFADVQDAFSAGTYDAWHFTGHGAAKDANPDRSSIYLTGDEPMTPEDVSGQATNLGLTHPLVFINACQVGRGGMALTGIGGWARRFVQVGAGAFIGAYWSVYDDAAFAFSKEVYKRLIDGVPIGDAVRDARAAVRTDGDPTWLAYTVFADPLAAIEAKTA